MLFIQNRRSNTLAHSTKRVLFVEDDPTISDYVRELLDNYSVTHIHAINYDDTKAALLLHTFDLVITDFSFPGGNGDLVLELARSYGIKDVYLYSAMISQSKRANEYTNLFSKSDIHDFRDFLKSLQTT